MYITTPRRHRTIAMAAWLAFTLIPTPVPAQDLATASRVAVIEQAKADKAATVRPYEPSKVEAAIDRVEDIFLSGRLHWHPFFQSAYAGGGFTLGAGYSRFVSPYNTVDLRGSITFSGYKRIEAEFLAPRLFDRRGVLSVIGGWREATPVGFYGLGTATHIGGRPRQLLRSPSRMRPPRSTSGRPVVSSSCAAASRSRNGRRRPAAAARRRSTRSTRRRRCPDSAPPRPTCTRRAWSASTRAPRPGYARRGGFYGVTAHDYTDTDDTYGFTGMDYEALQHIPVLRDAWVLSLHARVETTHIDDDGQIPFFMLPALGGGSSAAGLCELAVPRPQQPAAAGRVARAGQPVPRHGAVCRRRQGHRARRRLDNFHGMKKRLRPRLPAARPARHAAAHRTGEEQRGTRAGVLGEGGVLMTTHPASLAVGRSLLGALAAAPAGTQAPRFYGDDPIGREPEPQDASRAEPWDIGLLYDLAYNCS